MHNFMREMPAVSVCVQIFFSSNLVRFPIRHSVSPFPFPSPFMTLFLTFENQPLAHVNLGGLGEAMEAAHGWLEQDIPLFHKAIYQPIMCGSTVK